MWRELYPVGIHYLIGQILGSAVLLWLVNHVSNAQESYYSYTLVITGLTGVLVMFPAVYFYRKDCIGRLIGGLTSIEEQRLSVPEMLLLLAAGAGFAQYANVLVAILQNWISSSYGETMTKITSGKSLFMMIFWMGIVAPIAEEMIFRWLVYLRLRDHFSVLVSAVISAAFFGIYHGNVLQAVYAFILGGLFAWFLEMGCAYCVGMLIGKHKMAPVLSPKKSIEGAVGGVVGAALLGVIYAAATQGKMAEYALICAVGALISMVGDLAASAIKRNQNIKDYGKLIPGHGGILDRFDSVIITAPVIYYLAKTILGI